MNILIVEDHPIVRSGLRRLLAAEAVEIREAASGEEGLALFRTWQPSLVILDLNLPGIGGLAMLERLKSASPGARVLVLSMHDDPMHVTRALRAGAAGYVSKNARPEEIVEAVRRVARGRTFIEHAIAEELVFAGIEARPELLSGLSTRELEVLRLLAEGCSLAQIADTIGVSYKTAANSCSRIKAKIGALSTADCIRAALHAGLVDRDPGLSPPPDRRRNP
jgi:two-component system, NarL family, invasion response regulator UvrY